MKVQSETSWAWMLLVFLVLAVSFSAMFFAFTYNGRSRLIQESPTPMTTPRTTLIPPVTTTPSRP